MQNLAKIEQLETVSLMLFILGILLLLTAVLVMINAFGGLKKTIERLQFRNIKKKAEHEKAPESNVQQVHENEKKLGFIRRTAEQKKKSEKLMNKQEQNIVIQAESSSRFADLVESDEADTTQLTTESSTGMDETSPLDKIERDSTFDESDDATTSLKSAESENKFRIVKKQIITHDHE